MTLSDAMTPSDAESILRNVRFDEKGLAPAIVQDAATREVLMLAYMNRESLELTLARGEAHFFSRSRNAIWRKGATSGNLQSVGRIRLDCDCDTLLLEVTPQGPACHKGTYSCFEVEPRMEGVLGALYALVADRRKMRPEGSYTTYLFESGLDKILKKVGEEATETIVAAKNSEARELTAEVADLLYHLIVLLVEREVPLEEVALELNRRHASKSGRD